MIPLESQRKNDQSCLEPNIIPCFTSWIAMIIENSVAYLTVSRSGTHKAESIVYENKSKDLV